MRILISTIIVITTFIPNASLKSDAFLKHDFTFVRLQYSGRLTQLSNWRVDWPASDRNFIYQLSKQTNIDVAPDSIRIPVGSEDLFDYPFAYILEVGSMQLNKAEAKNLREYLLRGGFIFVDDFHGGIEWKRFYTELKKIFPKREPIDISNKHPIFRCFYTIEELIQIPGLRALYSGRTYERFDGHPARYLGVFDDKGRIMMFICFNSDLGDAWEHAAEASYPREYSNIALKIGINAVIYSMTH
ncbi:MAG: DUF4159 domain-containing protein [Candidatus Poribacteria bacterium]|nr:DUF4159 domain-containing protein [Candidatus Poribacteria bacterium]